MQILILAVDEFGSAESLTFTTMNHKIVTENQTDESLKAAPRRAPLYLFACHIAWRHEGNFGAFQELLAALDDPAEEVRTLAESFLIRTARQLLTSGR